MDYQYIKTGIEAGVGQLILARSDKHNAFNAEMIQEIIQGLTQLKATAGLRLLLLSAEGKNFCAGADLNWMRSQASMSEADNIADARQLALLLQTLDQFPTPVLTLVQGAAFGGAIGLIACSDLVIAQPNSKFCLSEVKLGLIPATISPYVARVIGTKKMRRYALTAEMITAEKALQLGLVDELSDDLAQVSIPFIEKMKAAGPEALKACKCLLHHVGEQAIDEALIEYTACAIASIRCSDEGQEGLSAFFAKRAPNWQQPIEQENKNA